MYSDKAYGEVFSIERVPESDFESVRLGCLPIIFINIDFCILFEFASKFCQ